MTSFCARRGFSSCPQQKRTNGRVATDIPSREKLAGKHGLAMPRWHGDDQAGDATPFNTFQSIRNHPVMLGDAIPRPLISGIGTQQGMSIILSR